jgi:hypothetical protein
MPEHCRRQAKEMRELAAQVSLRSDKRRLLEMAEDYERQAAAKAAADQGRRESSPAQVPRA